MIICEREFEDPDPRYPDFSMCEVDILSTAGFRLTIRKCLKTGKFQAYRSWFNDQDKVKHATGVAFQPNLFGKDGSGFYDVEVVSEGSLADVLSYTNGVWKEIRPVELRRVDSICPHEGSWRERAVGCKET